MRVSAKEDVGCLGCPFFFLFLMLSGITRRIFFAFGDYWVVFKFVSVGFGDYFFSLAWLGFGIIWLFCDCLLEMVGDVRRWGREREKGERGTKREEGRGGVRGGG